jgi:hypothetical protein
MKKLNSKQLKTLTQVFAGLTLFTLSLIIAYDWKKWIEHPKMPWLPLIFMFISIILLQKSKQKKEEETSGK